MKPIPISLHRNPGQAGQGVSSGYVGALESYPRVAWIPGVPPTACVNTSSPCSPAPPQDEHDTEGCSHDYSKENALLQVRIFYCYLNWCNVSKYI